MESLKNTAKLIAKMLIRGAAHIFWVIPVKTNRIVFVCQDMNRYCCNPKYVHKYLEEHYGNSFEYIWLFKHPEKQEKLKGIRIVNYYSVRRFYAMATAKVIICNSPPDSLYPRRKNQLFINTWHAGGAYKRVGKATISTFKDRWSHSKILDDVNVYLSSSRLFTQFNIQGGFPVKGEILNIGMPRNDVFFDEKKIEEYRGRVKRQFGVNGPIVLYAPTYRGDLKKAKWEGSMLDVNRVIESCNVYSGENVSLLMRAHHFNTYNRKIASNILDASTYPDMQELLCAADILITDYSSSIWDYALLGKPCFLYVPDLEEYEKEDRGFFTPIETWPGIVCHDMDELCYEIEHLDEDRCREIARKHLEYAGSYEQGTACETVCKKIVEFCRGEAFDRKEIYEDGECAEHRKSKKSPMDHSSLSGKGGV